MDEREFRDALGRFPTGVCLTTLTDAQGRARALTINSFSSVSLDPPLVLWSLQKSAETYAVFATQQRFAISVLSVEQEGLSTQYAMKGEHFMDAGHFTLGDNGAPVVTGALAVFECELDATHDAGDHIILVGRVQKFSSGAKGSPLVFYGGCYRELASE